MLKISPFLVVLGLALSARAQEDWERVDVRPLVAQHAKTGYATTIPEPEAVKRADGALQRIAQVKNFVTNMDVGRNTYIKSNVMRKSKLLELEIAAELIKANRDASLLTYPEWTAPEKQLGINPQVGQCYQLGAIKILEVIGDRDVHAGIVRDFLGGTADARLYVRFAQSDPNRYGDEYVHTYDSLFACVGTHKYPTAIGGSHTIPVLVECTKEFDEYVRQHIPERDKMARAVEADYSGLTRAWTSADGKFSRTAHVVSANKTNVELQIKGGEKVTVDLNDLSYIDRLYVGSYIRAKDAIVNETDVVLGPLEKLMKR